MRLERAADRRLQAQGCPISAARSPASSACPTSPFRPERVKPLDLLRNLKRDYIQQAQWLPLEENPEGLLILVTDPEQAIASRVVQNASPRPIRFTGRPPTSEFAQAVAQFLATARTTAR